MEKLYTVNENKTRSWLWLRSWTPYCQIQTQIEESKENTRPFRYDLNQIPYNYTVEMTNRFMGLDLIDRVPEELWMEVQNQKAKWWSEEALQITVKRREDKGKGEKEK